MDNRIRRFFACIAALLLILPLSAQNRSVSLTLQDSSTKEPVAFATVSLTKKGAQSAYKYALTDDKGQASIDKVASGEYTLKAELLGYKALSLDVKVEKDPVALGIVKMDPDTELLDAARVSDVGNPIVVKKDTIEYNASSFKTTDNDMLEQLLKKLPGIEVAEDGSITANGQTINKITIDGKTFFLDDPQLASKNIPAKIIDKVKVVEKKSEQAEFTGIDDGNEEFVIDLSIQKGMMHGLFGNVMAGAGHDVPSPNNDMNDWRFQGAGFMGRFTEKDQISVILNGNNTNNRGFNDLAGSMMQGMRGGGGGMGRGQGGWGMGNGITTSWMAGINGATNLLDDKMELQGNYLYNGSSKYVEEITDKTTYLDGYNRIDHTDGSSITGTWGHRVGARVEHKFSENTSILFQPQFNFGGGSFSEQSNFTAEKDLLDGSEIQQLSRGFSRNLGTSRNQQANGWLLFRQKLGTPGRTLSIMGRYNFQNTDMEGINQSLTTNFSGGSSTDDPVNQRYDQNRFNRSLSSRLTYTEPLGKGFFLEANYEFSWSKNTSWKNTFDSSDNSLLDAGIIPNAARDQYKPFDPESGGLNDLYSNEIYNRSIDQRIGANFVYQMDKLRAQIGFAANPNNTLNKTKGYEDFNPGTRWNWAPSAMLWYDFADNSNARFFYHGRTHQPSTNQLMPVLDNSNPLAVSLGNPYLTPYFTHGFRGDFRLTNKKTFFSLNFNLDGNLNQNPIVSATWYEDGSAAQYSMPVNGHTGGNVNARMFINAPIGKTGLSIFSMTRGGYTNSSSYVGKSGLDMSGYYKDDGSFDYNKFHTEVPDLDADGRFSLNTIRSVVAAQRLRLTYRNDFVELTAGARTRMNKSWYTIATAKTQTTWNNQLTGSMNWTIPGGVGLVADVNYNWYRGYTTPQDSEVILNAEITKLLFKNRMTLSLKAYDILAQAKNLSITDASNYHSESWNNTLGRYIILSVTWRFGNFGDAMKNMRGPGGPRGGGPRRM